MKMDILNISDLYTKEDILKDKKQPVIISELLINGLVPSLTVIPDNLRLFDFYLNYGSCSGEEKQKLLPEKYKYLCDFNEAMEVTEKSSYEDFDEAIEALCYKIDTGITLGSMWINHPELGNQIYSMIERFINGSASFFTLQESYFEQDACNDFKKKRNTLLSHYTHFYIEDGLLNCNVSLHDVDIEDIILHLNMRNLLSFFILSSDKFQNIKSGNINFFINNYIVPEEKIKRTPLIRYEIFTGKDMIYPEVYYSGEKISIFNDYYKHLKITLTQH